MRDLVCIFPDTNLFLHYPPLKDIDWGKLAEAKSAKLVICMTVIHELDSKKSDPRLGKRAERAIKEIREAIKADTEVRSGVTLVIFNREVSLSEFPHSLSPDSADDRIVHLVKCYANEVEGPVAIATGDFGMELRAEAGGIETISLDTLSRLENPLDEQTKKLREVQRELNEFKLRLPKLSLRVLSGSGLKVLPQEMVFELGEVCREIDVDREINRIRKEYPKHDLERNSEERKCIPDFYRERWINYNSKLESFYLKSREHFEFVNVINAAKARSFWFDLWIANYGNGLATDIDAFLLFPEIIQLVAESGTSEARPLEEKLVSPKPPSEPSFANLVHGLGSGREIFPSALNLPVSSGFPRQNEWEPDTNIRQGTDGRYEIHARLRKLKQGHEVSLGKFVVMFGSPELVAKFCVDASISTVDLPNEIECKLPFSVSRKDGSSSE